MSAELRSAGEVDIQLVEVIAASGKSLDIRNQILSVNIYESIFSPFITGSILVKDSLELINFFPLTGEETLNIRIATPGYTDVGTYINNRFFIYKITDREDLAERSVVYTLHFISVEALMDLNLKISKRYDDTISNIANRVLNEFSFTSDKNRIHVEPTQNKLTYISNFWSPVQNLNYLAERAVNINGSPTFLFFENRNGLNFCSLESLYNNNIVQTFYGNNYTRQVNPDGSSVRNIEYEYKAIVSIVVPTIFDYVERLRSGALSSTLITHDLTNKRYSYSTFDFLDDYDKETRLNKFPIISKKAPHFSTAAIKTLNRSTALFAGGNDITGARYFQRRKSLLALADSCKVNITVLGRTDYTVGQKVYIDLSKNMVIDKTDTDVKDHMFSGNYIISSIKHIIDRDMHNIEMECIKDSLDLDLNNIKS